MTGISSATDWEDDRKVVATKLGMFELGDRICRPFARAVALMEGYRSAGELLDLPKYKARRERNRLKRLPLETALWDKLAPTLVIGDFETLTVSTKERKAIRSLVSQALIAVYERRGEPWTIALRPLGWEVAHAQGVPGAQELPAHVELLKGVKMIQEYTSPK